MKVDDTFNFLMGKANLSSYRYSVGENTLANVEFWADKLLRLEEDVQAGLGPKHDPQDQPKDK